MSKLEAIEAEVRKLPPREVLELQDWLADYLEDHAELNPSFVTSIERGEADLREGRVGGRSRLAKSFQIADTTGVTAGMTEWNRNELHLR